MPGTPSERGKIVQQFLGMGGSTLAELEMVSKPFCWKRGHYFAPSTIPRTILRQSEVRDVVAIHTHTIVP